MDFRGREGRFHHLEAATDAAVLLRELEWKKGGLTDDDRGDEYTEMFRTLKTLNERSLREALEYSDPKALFDMVCYAKHLGMWSGYRQNEHRLRFVDMDEDSREPDV